MKATKVLFINTEIVPYMPENSVSNIGRYLPQRIQESGHEIRTFMPKFGLINERRNQLHEVIRLSGMNLIINDTDHPLIIKVASVQAARMQIYFIDNDDYFTRRYTYTDENGVEFADNSERCLFYARGVLETIRKLRWIPDVVVCQGWFTSIAPIYIKRCFADDPFFKNAKVIFALYNDAFKTPFPETFAKMIKRDGITKTELSWIDGKHVSHTDLCKLAIKYSDGVIIMEPSVDKQILEYAQSLNLPIMEHPEGDNYVEAYNQFFDQITGEE